MNQINIKGQNSHPDTELDILHSWIQIIHMHSRVLFHLNLIPI